MAAFILNQVVKYLESHPEIVEQLIHEIFSLIVKQIQDAQKNA